MCVGAGEPTGEGEYVCETDSSANRLHGNFSMAVGIVV